MFRLFNEIEMPLVFTLYDMEQAGVKIEGEELKRYGEELGARIVELEKEIYEMAGEEFNINSPKQLGVILFEFTVDSSIHSYIICKSVCIC